MKRSLLRVLLVLGALSACQDAPPGQLEPIPRPEGYVEPPKAEAATPPAPAADPNKVVLRWKLAEGTPVAFRLEGTPEAASAAGKKGESSPAASRLKTVYVLQRPKAGDYLVRVAPEGRTAAQDQGTLSERGFILDGLGGIDRNVATLLLELPKNPVGVGDTWSLGADLVDTTRLGPGFAEKKADRRNTVKLAALAPEGDEQVATIEYELHDRVEGVLSPVVRDSRSHSHGHSEAEPVPVKPPADKGKKGKGKKGKGKSEEEARPAEPAQRFGELTAEVRFTGRGEFLVKAGRWRSWGGTLSSKTEGYTPPSPDKAAAQVPAGTLKLRLTALESVPPGLQPAAQK